MIRAIAALLVASLLGSASVAAQAPDDGRRSGLAFMGPALQAMQQDDASNPAMLWVAAGQALWQRPDGPAGRSCATCHGDAAVSMRGVAPRYPMLDAASGMPIDLQGRAQQCRVERQGAAPLASESEDLLGVVAYMALQSRGMAVAPPDDPALAPFRERGREFWELRQGQLDLACAQCHDARWGERLGGSVIPQAHPTGYPIFRLEWQAMGSLQRRLRNCLTGVRAEAFPYGAPELVELELYLMERARGLPMETPAVRP